MRVLCKYLKEHYKKVIYKKDYLMAEGDLPVCLVAHLDTVFAEPPQDIYVDKEKKVIWSPQGLGADDRAGVYAIVDLIEKGYRPSVIFTTEEEVGGIGASKLITKYKTCPFDIKFIIELDRQGLNDCVFYNCGNENFEKYINNFGFITNYGTFSDISIIAPYWDIAAVNLSIGYYLEHSKTEHLKYGELEETIDKVVNILNNANEADYFKYMGKKENHINDFIWDPKECLICKCKFNNANKIKITGADSFGKYTYYVCPDCYKAHFK